MQRTTQFLALAAALSTVSAGNIQGFNYGSKNTDNTARMQADFETAFKTAQNLVGTNNAFTSARLYTMIQAYSTSDVISAIPAAIATNTSLLLGLWASGTGFENEITALKSAISTYGSQLAPLVTGISVGSEDLYRNGVTSIKNGGGIGQDPATLLSYIKEVRSTISGTPLSSALVGHVDTWDAYTNGTNAAVIEALDFVGLDTYPYWQYNDGNDVSNGPALFTKAYDATKAAIGTKDIWVTETGWAVAGENEGQAVAGTAEAKEYWDSVGCDLLFGKFNTWWYTLSESGASPNFGVSNSDSNTSPLYDLSCSNITSSSVSSSNSSSISSSSSGTTGSGVAGSGVAGSGSSASDSSSGSSSGNSSSSSSGSSAGSSSGTHTGTSSSNGTTWSNSTATGTGTGSAATATSTILPGNTASANMVPFGGLLAAVALAFAL